MILMETQGLRRWATEAEMALRVAQCRSRHERVDVYDCPTVGSTVVAIVSESLPIGHRSEALELARQAAESGR